MLSAKSQLHLHNIWSRNIFPFDMENCVAYFPLWQEDMQGSSVISYDQYHRVGTVTGATWGSQGRTGDGNDYISTPAWTPPDAISIEAWVKPSELTNTYTICGWSDAGFTTYTVLYFNTVAAVVYLQLNIIKDGSNYGVWRGSYSTFTINNWYHVMVTQATPATAPLMYVGTPTVAPASQSVAQISLVGTPAHTSNVFAIMVPGAATATNPYKGVEGEVRIDSKVRSVADGIENYQKTKGRYQ